MEKPKIVKLVRREVRALLRLTPWMLVSLLVAAVLWRTDTAAISGLFQSVQSPVATPTALPPTAIPTQEPTQVPTEVPTEASTAEPTATEAITATATVTPSATMTATPAATATAEATATAAPSATTQPSPSPSPEATAVESGRYPEDPTLKFDWGVLFDSVALGISYVWLCCGVLLLVSIPVLFVILWVVSKRRQEQEE
jgi:cytoskeletal protein RodZ